MALTLAFSAAGVMATPAGAATAQSCTKVVGTLTMSPGLGSKVQDQKVTVQATESSCTPSKATGGTGAFLFKGTLKQANCATLGKGGSTFSAPATTTWKNGKKTNYTLTLKGGSGSTLTRITMTGKATNGALFTNKRFTGGFDLTPVGNPDCVKVPFKKATIKQSKPWVLS